jgi:serine/threonine-protein kinase
VRILIGLCDALGEAHALGVIHRDLKPENILLEARPANPEFVKVLDFGLAKVLAGTARISAPGQTIGTIEFNSPEQLQGSAVDGRSDLYALGVLGYLLVTGHHPFHDVRMMGDMASAHIHRVPAAASSLVSVPLDVDALLARLLEKDPARRYPDAGTVAAMIAFLLSRPAGDGGDTIKGAGP